MNGETWERIEAVFQAACVLAGEEREWFLDNACAQDATLRAEVESLLAAHDTPDASLQGVIARAASQVPAALPAPRAGQRIGVWELGELIGSGGMGSVFLGTRADRVFEKQVAIKLVKGGVVDEETERRFVQERQALACLEHPNIARLLDGGTTEDGRPYIVMEHVPGVPIDAWCDARHLALRARIELVRTVAAAVHHAHRNLIVHRDLKPGNILVTDEGEPKLLDFGIAKLLESDASLTATGEWLLTPEYASPEQLEGRVSTTASDVYALGVVLYELLTGRKPFENDPRKGITALVVNVCTTEAPLMSEVHAQASAIQGSPEPEELARLRGTTLDRLRRDLLGDLDNILAMALRKEPERRYASVAAFAEDLRAYLAGLPVSARKDTLRYRAIKFARRNKALVAAVAGGLLALVGGLGGIGYVEAKGRTVAEKARAEAEQNEKSATEAKERVLRLSDVKRVQDLEAEAALLWPAHPGRVPAYVDWLARAETLAGRTDEHRASLLVLTEDGVQTSTEQAWQREVLRDLIARMGAFVDPATGTVPNVRERLAFARAIAERSVSGAQASARWKVALAAIEASEHYGGLQLEPQLGLLPLGPDPVSGLHEFAHLQTGAPPVRGDDERWILGEETGLVFVLLPGGTFWMGSQASDPELPNHDVLTRGSEVPVHEVTLAPFFLSKYEMTQAQWQRFKGRNPSQVHPGISENMGRAYTLVHPVEFVSWNDARETVFELGLELPTEAQWEYAARAGTDTPWSTGAERESLVGSVNIDDRSAVRSSVSSGASDWPELDDGHPLHAPVGSLRPNPFGLHEMHGNVMEWCRDIFASYELGVRAGDGLREAPEGHTYTVLRGACFRDGVAKARCARRGKTRTDQRSGQFGLRPVRVVD